ncbi:MAG: hypothetical protein OXM01_16785 [Gemmatimonadota bacterium]|nr:hypothetical protein [Gemmatimonadota bacterium]
MQATLEETPPGAAHWSCRSMAKAAGVSHSTVQRIWDAQELRPRGATSFRLLSADLAFVARVTDVVGAVPEPAGQGGGVVRG